MSVIVDKRCTGCSACESVCPVNCIEMKPNYKGFIYPEIDLERCINCGLCEKVCPLNHSEFSSPLETYAYVTTDYSVLERCASGGAFSDLAANWINDYGLVVAVADDVERGSAFKFISDIKEIASVAGSKYYQCNLTKSTINQIRDLLSQGKYILFCGTPCQCAAIKNTTSPELRGRLFLVDIICQGVPSRYVIKKYRQYLEDVGNCAIENHLFRCKKINNGSYVSLVTYRNGTSNIFIGEEDLFNRAFMEKIFLRESCYLCPFAKRDRIGDVTLGDFWGYDFNDTFVKGSTSLLICNNNKGIESAIRLNNNGIMSKSNIDIAVSNNIPLNSPVSRPSLRSISYKLLDRFGFKAAVSICCWKYRLKKIIRKH